MLLTANKNYSKIIKQINIFKPRVVIIYNEKVYLRVKKKYNNKNIIFLNSIINVPKYISKIDITVSAIPGIAGLEPTVFFTKIRVP